MPPPRRGGFPAGRATGPKQTRALTRPRRSDHPPQPRRQAQPLPETRGGLAEPPSPTHTPPLGSAAPAGTWPGTSAATPSPPTHTHPSAAKAAALPRAPDPPLRHGPGPGGGGPPRSRSLSHLSPQTGPAGGTAGAVRGGGRGGGAAAGTPPLPAAGSACRARHRRLLPSHTHTRAYARSRIGPLPPLRGARSPLDPLICRGGGAPRPLGGGVTWALLSPPTPSSAKRAGGR